MYQDNIHAISVLCGHCKVHFQDRMCEYVTMYLPVLLHLHLLVTSTIITV